MPGAGMRRIRQQSMRMELGQKKKFRKAMPLVRGARGAEATEATTSSIPATAAAIPLVSIHPPADPARRVF